MTTETERAAFAAFKTYADEEAALDPWFCFQAGMRFQAGRASLPPAEPQEPAGMLHDDGYFTWNGPSPYKSNFAGWRTPFYLAPVSPLSAPTMVMLTDEEIQESILAADLSYTADEGRSRMSWEHYLGRAILAASREKAGTNGVEADDALKRDVDHWISIGKLLPDAGVAPTPGLRVLNALEVLERAGLAPESQPTAAQFLKLLGERGMWVIENPPAAGVQPSEKGGA